MNQFSNRAVFKAALAVSLLSVLGACATAKHLAEFKRDFNVPVLNLQPVVREDEGPDRADFKRRDRRTPIIRIALNRRTAPKTVPALVVDTAYQKFTRLLDFKDVRLVNAGSQGNLLPVVKPATREFLKKNQIDGVADIQLVEKDAKNFTLKLELRDPYDGELITDLSQDFQVNERAVDPKHQLEFYNQGGTFAFLEGERSPQVVMLQPRPPEALHEILTQTVTGRMNVSASTTETEVYLWPAGNRRARKKLGNTPISSFRLSEGKHTLEIRRRGYRTQVKPIQVRSGKLLEVLAPWPDDPVIQTATILSTPPGLQLSMDGTVRGETPVYLTGLESGSYNLEVARGNKDGAFEVVAEGSLEVAESDQPERLFIIDYKEDFGADVTQTDIWRLSSENGKVAYQAGPGLSFKNQSGGANAWQGLVSQPFYIDNFQMTTRVVEGEGNVLAFGLRSGDSTVLVEMNNNVYTTAIYAPDGARTFRSYQASVSSPDNSHFLRYKFNREKGILIVKLDGSTIYEGPFKAASTGRVLLLTRPESADGRVLAKSFSMKGGRGLLDSQLLDLPFVNETYDWLRSKWNRQ